MMETTISYQHCCTLGSSLPYRMLFAGASRQITRCSRSRTGSRASSARISAVSSTSSTSERTEASRSAKTANTQQQTTSHMCSSMLKHSAVFGAALQAAGAARAELETIQQVQEPATLTNTIISAAFTTAIIALGALTIGVRLSSPT